MSCLFFVSSGAPVHQFNVTVHQGNLTEQEDALVKQGNAIANKRDATVHQWTAAALQENAIVHLGNVSYEAQSDNTYDDDVFHDVARKFLLKFEYTWEDVKYLQGE